jgi:hypothetical protein
MHLLGCRMCSCGERNGHRDWNRHQRHSAGTANDDILNGLTGADKMSGGEDSDGYFIAGGEVVTELENKGDEDYIVPTISLVMPATVEFPERVAGGYLRPLVSGGGDSITPATPQNVANALLIDVVYRQSHLPA